ncbi:MAG: methyltransferase domain-containing protein [Bacteroidetes bacterium]|nr:methyltransferase domain-containing protein [Bacteroidota bacterium]
MQSKVKIDLGCGKTKPEGFIGIDIAAGDGVDIVHDLGQGIPMEDSSVDYVRAYDFVEHLPNKLNTMNEIWRVLKPGGTAEIFVPSTEGSGAFQDPTHVSFWNKNSFLYFTTEVKAYLELGQKYGFKGTFNLIKFVTLVKGKPWNEFGYFEKRSIIKETLFKMQSPIVHHHVILECVK